MGLGRGAQGHEPCPSFGKGQDELRTCSPLQNSPRFLCFMYRKQAGFLNTNSNKKGGEINATFNRTLKTDTSPSLRKRKGKRSVDSL